MPVNRNFFSRIHCPNFVQLLLSKTNKQTKKHYNLTLSYIVINFMEIPDPILVFDQ